MLDFMAISSYGKGARESTGNVRLRWIATNIHNKMCCSWRYFDSGHTIRSFCNTEAREPKSLKVCACLTKGTSRAVVPVIIVALVFPIRCVRLWLDLMTIIATCPLSALSIWKNKTAS